jgi:hypothetical protein
MTLVDDMRLTNRINNFLTRKADEYPELHLDNPEYVYHRAIKTRHPSKIRHDFVDNSR